MDNSINWEEELANIEDWEKEVQDFEKSKELYPEGEYNGVIKKVELSKSMQSGDKQVHWTVLKEGDDFRGDHYFDRYDNLEREDGRNRFMKTMWQLDVEVPAKLSYEWCLNKFEEMTDRIVRISVRHGMNKKSGKMQYENLYINGYADV